ncbi:MAG: GNAT family N-acetyltransferase [Verrucomicrobia bacterium]|nr:GNAT family N-acetyltransferase [Verrucomicrobiota bacterium]
MNSLLLNFPESFDTERLTIRSPQPGDGVAFNAALLDSLEACRPWMPWAQKAPTVEESEEVMRKAHARFLLREDLMLLVFLRSTGVLVASSGLHHIDWTVPRFEIGYWGRTPYCGHGYVTEAVAGIAGFAQQTLGARRVEIRAAEANVRSWRIPEKLGFAHEATLRQWMRTPDGTLHDLRVYSKVS